MTTPVTMDEQLQQQQPVLPSAATESNSHVWIPEVVERVANFLPRNDVASTLRLVSKSWAAPLSGPEYTVVHLSQQAQPHAFKERWGAPGAMRNLTFAQRLQLLCLVARTGSISNLQVAVEAAGIALPTPECKVVTKAAALAGQRNTCNWLLQHGCPMRNDTMEAVARAGQRESCEWLRRTGLAFGLGTVLAAARGGHLDLMEWLLQQQPPLHGTGATELLAAQAEGCELEPLQQFYQEDIVEEGVWLDDMNKERVLSAAAKSPTSDWQAKVEWLEELGFPKHPSACVAAATCPDALTRLVWLHGRGYRACKASVSAAVRAGNTAAVEYLLAEVHVQLESPIYEATGQLQMLQLLQVHGCPLDESLVVEAALQGHLPALAWLVDTMGLKGQSMLSAAASSGRVEVLSWLYERGYRWDEETMRQAADAGCEEVLEWLVEKGCPWGLDPYTAAADHGDMATLRWLRRRGCPWKYSSSGGTFVSCMKMSCCKPVLRWMREEGCPVNWVRAFSLARRVQPQLLLWLRQQRQAEERRQQEGQQ
ncbi:hypothetical protein Agub_g4786 [Astrephomene gubernaculifera]|uniref:Ankyrin repeat domain-containing protein n=1 Tax=Astrephomene gubernaculifera TaxID=47775 RepID=A0AAD3DLA2_9CHLO|nr:hypothetical protein Agub_g4786 [Astrephomene gubernaculifera]